MKHNDKVDAEIERLLDEMADTQPGTDKYDSVVKELDVLYARRLQEEAHYDDTLIRDLEKDQKYELESRRIDVEAQKVNEEKKSGWLTMGVIGGLTGLTYLLEAKGHLIPKDLLRWIDKIRF